jgi:hypothetical protein
MLVFPFSKKTLSCSPPPVSRPFLPPILATSPRCVSRGQMLVRLALLFLLIVLAPLGLLCFGLPQTQGYGRLWTSTFAATLFVQFFQVVALALGGMLISSTQTTRLLNLDTGVVSLLVSTAVLYLVLCIPGMIRSWALRPIAQAGLAPAQIAGRLISTFAG